MTDAAPRRRGRPARTARPVEETRAAILQAALTLFSQRGFEGAALRDIAAAAQVEHSLVRYHFSDKDTLWRAALRHLIDHMNATMGESWKASRGQAAVDRLKRFIRDYVRYCAQNPEHARIMVQEAVGQNDRVAWIAEEIVRPQHRGFARLLETLMAEGVLPRVPVRSLIYILSAAAQAPFTLAGEVKAAYGVDTAAEVEIDAHAETLIALFLRPPSSQAAMS